ncbi:MAG: hypothetical protein D3925_17950, partial [Candidatus Electrothrix sp. AR5]|nr:hypothetical protein [Candidatus Electrothrix sp. AR5]
GDTVQIYRLTKISPVDGDTLMLDMLLVTPDMTAAWESRQSVHWEGGELPVVSPRGLIELKSKRLSGQDQDDIIKLRSMLDEE